MLRYLLFCLFALAAPAAFAWNAAGHRLVALIAWQQMTPAARTVATDLLAAHPDHGRWQARSGDADAGRHAFLEAATWPDDIRGDSRFYDETREAPTPPLPGFTDLRRHRDWHYVDDMEKGEARRGELDRQLVRLAALLGNPRALANERAYALPWLLHLVADAHQPLHVGRHQDEGGNLFEIEEPAHPRLPHSNLHRWWDDLPGPPWLRGERLRRAADRLLRESSPPAQGNVALWLSESRRLSHDFAYPPTALITPEFRRAATAVAEQRLVEAGWRLGRWLNVLLDNTVNTPKVSRETASQ